MDKKEEKKEEKITINNMKDLMINTVNAENNYKLQKYQNEVEYNKLLLTTEWDKINDERKEKGLSKLSNQDLKKAYIYDKMSEKLDEEMDLEMKYNLYRRMYDVAMKYSYDILR